jgi:CDP-glucose 4,6-dehydratase
VKYLVTGHTGFKGAWLALVLHHHGHEVSGLSLDPAPGSLYERARVGELVGHDLRVDIRDAGAVREAVGRVAPDVVLHLAAQPLVRESYRNPRFTVETNVLGTYNVLDAVQSVGCVRAHVVVTTDKVYRNVGQVEGYREADPLGGLDPYAASKAATDILTQSWIASTTSAVPTAIARAGNVVGGGDVCPERLVVDLLAAYDAGRPAVLRNPDAVRPWQHVLDCLQGYLVLVDALLDGRAAGEAFNFGPAPSSSIPVGALASRLAGLWGPGASWRAERPDTRLREAALLTLDAGKAEAELGWHSVLDVDETLQLTVDWAKRAAAGEDAREISLAQVAAFAESAARAPLPVGKGG